jgi:peptidyl-prolyl cis-trans isomerase C
LLRPGAAPILHLKTQPSVTPERQRKTLDLLQKMNEGEKFARCAKRFSKCPSGKDGGDLGWFGKGMMVKEFEEAAFGAQMNKVVGPVRTQFGYHLILVTESR